MDQLLVQGAFRPLTLDSLLHKTPLPRFSIRDKRALALKLDLGLMDFFDSEFSSKSIYFLGSSETGLQKESSYLAFCGPRRPGNTQSCQFRPGHPGLTAFAKLLLEIELGESIDLQISPDSSQNLTAHAELLRHIERLAVERSDSYLRAVSGCLFVRHGIPVALPCSEHGEGPHSTIRRTLYEEVVHYLELSLSESTPRIPHKRQRSGSPPKPDLPVEPRAASSRIVPRQSLPEPPQASPPIMANGSHQEVDAKSGIDCCRSCRYPSSSDVSAPSSSGPSVRCMPSVSSR